MNPGCVAKAVYSAIPNVLDKLLLAYRAPLVKHQIFQDSRFLACQRQGTAFYGGDAGFGVKAEFSTG